MDTAAMREAEERAFAMGETPETLMEQAGRGMAEALHDLVRGPGRAVIYAGKGHNGGDALVAGLYLRRLGWTVVSRRLFPTEELAPLTAKQWERLNPEEVSECGVLSAVRRGPVVLIDGLLGLGAKGGLRGVVRHACEEIGRFSADHALVVSVDSPTGLDPDFGKADECAVRADWTMTVAWPKIGLLADEAEDFVGRLVVIPVSIPLPAGIERERPLIPPVIRGLAPRRRFSTYKGQAGRLLVIAGSPGLTGAAELACRGALRAGAGLVTLAAAPECLGILAARAPAEVMVRSMEPTAEEWGRIRADAVALGPGLSPAWHGEIRKFLKTSPLPCVVDAEALRALAGHADDLLREPTGPRLLTPHPGEMEALGGRGPRLERARAWRVRYPGTVLLWKGARTLIAGPGGLSWNTTGHPGMATGGMGDVLTGVAGAWLAQGVEAEGAAALAAWLCGRAAELAAAPGGRESVLPMDVTERLGDALRAARQSEW